MFWKSKERREEERIQREKAEEEQIAREIRLEQKKNEESDLLEELIRIPSRVGRYVVEAMSDDAAQSGHAFTESAEQVFFLDFIYIVLAFGRAEGALSYEMVKLLLTVGSGEVRQDSRSSKRINDAMWELQQTMTGSSVSRQALEVITDNFAGLLEGDKELIVVPRTVLALEIYDEKHGTTYAPETAKVFLKLVAKLAKGSDSIMNQPFDIYGPKAGWERPSLKAHQSVEDRFKELLGEIGTQPSSEARAKAMNKRSECAECVSAYQMLGLENGASRDDIQAAYRDFAKMYHPDRFPDGDQRLRERAEAEFKKVQQAHSHIVEHGHD